MEDLIRAAHVIGNAISKVNSLQEDVNTLKEDIAKLKTPEDVNTLKEDIEELKKPERQGILQDDGSIACCRCGIIFRHSGSLSRHYRSQHLREVTVCDLCGKWFIREDSVRKHRMVCKQPEAKQAKPPTCMSCGKAFLTEEHLRRHARLCRHSDGRQGHHSSTESMCSYCKKVFCTKYYMRQHQRICCHISPKLSN